ncbi:HNH endonuclease [Marilutibacter spongiae]|uniref:HNH endonuclease n=1 Tax=Marilutibacter spongiae TaxID=2025720 RepID=A0A7W3TPB1_9GAMM|nr:HNH endonuclease [Lysobacter spongiae]MBB1062006.1 HNH endonuclease [Lysobacter spongiae]
MEFEGKSISGEGLALLVHELRLRRRGIKAETKAKLGKRAALTNAQREQVLRKTGGRCHICGGAIEGPWHADHVFPHSAGGAHAVDNYLPAHDVCNTYRWDYTPDEFQLILKLGVWLKGEILRETRIGRDAAERFVKRQATIAKRRRPKSIARPGADGNGDASKGLGGRQ